MTNGGGKHPKKKTPAKQTKGGKKTASSLSRNQLTKGLPKPEKPAT